MLSHVLQSKPRGSVSRELYRQGLGVGGPIFGLHCGPVATLVCLRLVVLLKCWAVYGVFQNYTGFEGVLFTDGVMNYSRSLVHVGLTIRGAKLYCHHTYLLLFHQLEPGALSVLVPVQSHSNSQLVFSTAGARSRAIWWHHGISSCIFAFLCTNSGGQRVSTTVASRFVKLHGHSNKTSHVQV